MNRWAEKTIRLANEGNYLDQLYSIYPNEDISRVVDSEQLRNIRELYNRRDNSGLLNSLLDLKKFPVKDSYVSFLRNDRDAIRRNPKTVHRICSQLYDMGFEKMKKGILAPKEANTRRGQQFRSWLLKTFKHISKDMFVKNKKGIIFLGDTEKRVLEFCKSDLGLGISKRPDFVAKANNYYIIGEAKFLSASGGNQGRGFDDAIKLASNTSGKAYKVALLDGEIWIKSRSEGFKNIEYTNACAMSALLLKKYLITI